MPASKPTGKKSFDECVREKIKAGHPRKQAVAAAYHQQREAQKPTKKKG